MLTENAVSLIDAADPAIFELETSTSLADRVSFLMAQRVARAGSNRYNYLEIGSYLGGTLLPYLLDPICERIISIDKRPISQPDERARQFFYVGVTTAVMIDRLRVLVPEKELGKLRTFDADASQVSSASVGCKIDIALIDGEHTTTAAFSDF